MTRFGRLGDLSFCQFAAVRNVFDLNEGGTSAGGDRVASRAHTHMLYPLRQPFLLFVTTKRQNPIPLNSEFFHETPKSRF